MEELTKNSGEGIYGIVYKDKVVWHLMALNLNYKTTSNRLRGRTKNDTHLIYV